MTDSALPDGRSAGQRLRELRLAAGVDAGALAAQIKVPRSRIEALEGDRLEELPGNAFARGLAQAICRSLGADPRPILERMPRDTGQGLEQVAPSLNAPFRERTAAGFPALLGTLRRPMVWVPVLLLLAAVALWWAPVLPSGLGLAVDGAATGAASAASAASAANTSVTETISAAPTPGVAVGAEAAPSPITEVGSAAPALAAGPQAAAPGTPSPTAATGGAAGTATAPILPADATQTLRLQASGTSWVEVRDARGAVLLSRTLQPGETVALTGELPLQAVVGNAGQTTAAVRGQPFDFSPYIRDNVARFQVR